MNNKDSEALPSQEDEAEFREYEKKIKELDTKLAAFGSVSENNEEMNKSNLLRLK